MKEAKIKYDKKKKVDAINNGMNVVNGSKTPTTPTGDEISSDIVSTKGIDYAEQFKKDIVNNPDLLKQNEELNAVNLEIKTLEDQKKATFDEFIAAHPGVSTGAALLWASKENEAVDKRLNQLYDKQSVGSANLKYQTDLAMKAFDYKVQQQRDAQSMAFDLAKIKNAQEFQISQDERNYRQQVQFAGIQNQYQNSRDVKAYKRDLQKIRITDVMQTNRDKLNFSQQKELAAIQNKYQTSRDVQSYENDISKIRFQYENDPEKIAKQIENSQNNGVLSVL